jgi:hypothetical protein
MRIFRYRLSPETFGYTLVSLLGLYGMYMQFSVSLDLPLISVVYMPNTRSKYLQYSWKTVPHDANWMNEYVF